MVLWSDLDGIAILFDVCEVPGKYPLTLRINLLDNKLRSASCLYHVCPSAVHGIPVLISLLYSSHAVFVIQSDRDRFMCHVWSV